MLATAGCELLSQVSLYNLQSVQACCMFVNRHYKSVDSLAMVVVAAVDSPRQLRLFSACRQSVQFSAVDLASGQLQMSCELKPPSGTSAAAVVANARNCLVAADGYHIALIHTESSSSLEPTIQLLCLSADYQLRTVSLPLQDRFELCRGHRQPCGVALRANHLAFWMLKRQFCGAGEAQNNQQVVAVVELSLGSEQETSAQLVWMKNYPGFIAIRGTLLFSHFALLNLQHMNNHVEHLLVLVSFCGLRDTLEQVFPYVTRWRCGRITCMTEHGALLAFGFDSGKVSAHVNGGWMQGGKVGKQRVKRYTVLSRIGVCCCGVIDASRSTRRNCDWN